MCLNIFVVMIIQRIIRHKYIHIHMYNSDSLQASDYVNFHNLFCKYANARNKVMK